jgi:hypothetical protein
MVELVDEAEALVAQPAALGVADLGQITALECDAAGGRRIEAAEQVQERALARTAGADDGDSLAGPMSRSTPRAPASGRPAVGLLRTRQRGIPSSYLRPRPD